METRLVAIMLTDVSGYTEFSSHADHRAIEQAVRQQQQLIPPLVEKHGGRLVKWMGDAALAVFSSATEALLCGRRIQQSFMENAERSETSIKPRIKVVVHAGEVMVDGDGDVYGDPVNLTARLEKAASDTDEIYLSAVVRDLVPRSQFSIERVGEFDFKGIAGKTVVYRTCFGKTPVVREETLLAQTTFVDIQDLADEHGWDVVHPTLDAMTDAICEAGRAQGATVRGTLIGGGFLSFGSVALAARAVRDWTARIHETSVKPIEPGRLKVRTALHRGTLHVMKHTMMGRDIDIVRTLGALGVGDEVLMTAGAREAAQHEGLNAGCAEPVALSDLRECGSRRRWERRYSDIPVRRLPLARIPEFLEPQ